MKTVCSRYDHDIIYIFQSLKTDTVLQFYLHPQQVSLTYTLTPYRNTRRIRLLLDKVMSLNQSLIGDIRSQKKVCLEQNISIGSFHASFHNFSSCFYICELITKANNDLRELNNFLIEVLQWIAKRKYIWKHS